jgi:hypothetical protein
MCLQFVSDVLDDELVTSIDNYILRIKLDSVGLIFHDEFDIINIMRIGTKLKLLQQWWRIN